MFKGLNERPLFVWEEETARLKKRVINISEFYCEIPNLLVVYDGERL